MQSTLVTILAQTFPPTFCPCFNCWSIHFPRLFLCAIVAECASFRLGKHGCPYLIESLHILLQWRKEKSRENVSTKILKMGKMLGKKQH
jgi:hypothetical protein